MRRVALVAALVLSLLIPTSVVAAGSGRCSLSISPEIASPTDIVRLTISDVPVDSNGGSIEVEIHIRRLGTRDGSIIWAFLVPGTTEFFVNYNEAPPGEPSELLTPGRYQVDVSTHVRGCYTVGQFVVR